MKIKKCRKCGGTLKKYIAADGWDKFACNRCKSKFEPNEVYILMSSPRYNEAVQKALSNK